ncbi:hypothetical protein K493DRAFT_409623 [Basidiobolus meristosporus CBS 931.73]|uniref:chitin synthase n=1 Tax=Basidiobolus meristosporus CBS 931.73 TaxID=1314790 RepID=A0A1Y1XYQ3_9FUNG|nr:hypothetical protein K493DRAFT_409623 [Basidiobolus meristosporus CBS 931.73]|eukprot:ORX90887.1 hypothetical protein K493DRAFT_409623 [Basidiobolus meristosporus CBS 931.73]
MSSLEGIPMFCLTDSYKITHPFVYPEAKKMVAYGEFRAGFEDDTEDTRMILFGLRYIIETYVSKKWTLEELEKADKFFSTHNAGFTPFPFPKDLFQKFIQENNGHFPVKIEALPEGSVCYKRTPVYQITAVEEYSRLVTFLETILTMVWYPSTVATLSRRVKDLIEKAYEKTVDEDSYWTLNSRLHDFGFRACTSIEQSVLGGTAHLLNFEGTDTLSAAYYAQFMLNGGNPVGSSIPATEHSVMTSFKTEQEAMKHMINTFGTGVYACVMDSYDYAYALNEVLPSVAQAKLEKGGFLVIRPDSGDQIEAVMMGLRAADKVFGSTVNKKGYKVLNNCGVIQGDGLSYELIKKILVEVEKSGFSAQSVAFGMGGGLLQKVNRDTMSFATKLCHIVYADGTERDVMKVPKTDGSKTSLPGELEVRLNDEKIPMVYPINEGPKAHPNALQVVYDNGPIHPSPSEAMSGHVGNVEDGQLPPEDVTYLGESNLSDDSILECIKGRFEQAQAIHQNQQLSPDSCKPACYRDTSGNPHNLPPHVYEMATKAYLHLRRTGIDQSIILSGLTGSGKSESYRRILRQLCNLATHGKKESKLPGQIQNIQVVLEAFGNAMTAQNVNASRYSMFQEVQYNARGKISGAKTLTFLLEKYRVTDTPSSERNFNSFYYLLSGLSDEEKGILELTGPEDYHYLSHGQGLGVRRAEESEKFRQLRAAMKSLGIKTSSQTHIFRLLTGILHLGNIHFENHEDEECCRVKNADLLQLVAEILGVDYTALEETLTLKSKLIGKDICTIFLDVENAEKQRDALARAVVFAPIFLDRRGNQYQSILDPVGFQDMEHNRYEEFCINFANEKIQNFILKQMFDPHTGMNSELIADGLPAPSAQYSDNQACLDMFAGKSGLIQIIEESQSDENADHDIHSVISQRVGNHASYHSNGLQNQFSIKHYASTVTYHTDNFVEKNQDILDVNIVSLFRGAKPSTNTFISDLFSSSAVATESHPRSKETIVAARQSTKPTRQSSRRHPKKPDGKKESKAPGVLNQLNSTLNDLFDTMSETLIWNIFHINSNISRDSYRFDVQCVRSQISGFSLSGVAYRLMNDYTSSLEFSEFLERYQPFLESLQLDPSKDPRERVMSIKSISGWSDDEMYVGDKERVFLCEHVWKELEDGLRSMEKEERNAQKGRSSSMGLGLDTESLNSGYNGQVNTSTPAPYGAPSFAGDAQRSYSQFPREDSEYGSEFDFGREHGLNEIELAKTDKADKSAPIVESLPTSRARRSWLCITKLFTWWIPSITLSWCGMKRSDIQLAWREKVTLCILIVLLWGVLMFVIVGLGLILCPRVYYYNATDVAYHQAEGDLYAYMYGRVYDVSIFANQNHATGVSFEDMLSAITTTENNVEPYFEIPLNVQCPGLGISDTSTMKIQSDYQLAIQVPHQTGQFQLVPTNPMKPANWFYETALPRLNLWAKGDVAWEADHIRKMAQEGYRQWGIINHRVYDLTQYFKTLSAAKLAGNEKEYEFLSIYVRQVFEYSDRFGPDLTKMFNEKVRPKLTPEQYQANMNCLNKAFYIGVVDTRQGVKCKLSHWIPVSFAIVLCSVIVIKFLAALQLTSKRRPEDLDKFVICQVPCYTEDEDSLRKTIDSLAGLQYDDKRKLIFIIADGMIIGSGNDRPTPKIVCDILGVDPDYDPEPFSFKSIGEGNKQHNMAKVYSGLYEFEGHVVPYIVVAKVGKPSERSRPGNRGKRDSQIILMNFLNRVHFDSEMSPLDLEIYHQIKNVIGVNPAFYEYILMVDADTEVKADSLTRLIACMTHDARIIGLCGETQLANEEFSWATMIQVYEYYISHHLAKAFESLFGSVTCLPGCFCMYRIRTIKGSPLIINNEVINDYSENNVDTLHKKNLLSLGEDRYLTTLMLKHFPQYKMKFTSDAQCLTVAPDKWAVLLSQRRRWINSTVHNLFELVFLPDLCGFCFFSMRFVVMLDLFGTLVMPATVVYLFYLIISACIDPNNMSTIALIMFGVVYGLQAVIFIIKRQWQHVGWMIIYLLAMPLFGFAIPIYSFWHFDDFSWGNTRVIVGEKGEKKMISNEEPFDPESIPMKKWSDFEQEVWEAGSSVSRVSGSRPTSRSRSQTPFDGSQFSETRYRSQSPYAGSNYSGSQHPYVNVHDPAYSSQGRSLSRPSYRASPMPSFNHLPSTRTGYSGSRASMGYSPERAPTPSSFADYPPQMMPNRSASALGDYHSEMSYSHFPTDDEIIAEIRRILSTADLMTVTKKQVREELSHAFGVDMNSHREFINNAIELVLQGQL